MDYIMTNLNNSILNLISETEDIIFELRFGNFNNPLITTGIGIKNTFIKLKDKVSELDDLSRSKNKLNKISSELYSAKAANDKNKINILNKKLAYHLKLHKNLQHQHIINNQKYIQKTKEMEFKILELRRLGKDTSKLEKKYQKRKLFLYKVGLSDSE